jgi:hypothetical protein
LNAVLRIARNADDDFGNFGGLGTSLLRHGGFTHAICLLIVLITTSSDAHADSLFNFNPGNQKNRDRSNQMA